jgi:hypothetical protein
LANTGICSDKNGIYVDPYPVCGIVILGIVRVTETVILIHYSEPMISFFFA